MTCTIVADPIRNDSLAAIDNPLLLPPGRAVGSGQDTVSYFRAGVICTSKSGVSPGGMRAQDR